MVGALFVWIADWRGRKLAIFIGCVGVVIGAIVTATAPTSAGFIGGRFLLAFFSSIAVTAAPLILIEIAPPQYRAAVSGIYNTLYYFGSILASCAVYGTFKSEALNGTLLQWRLPLWIQIICPGLVALGIYFVPESPRWYVVHVMSIRKQPHLILNKGL
jgi:MFS family permease